MVNGQVCYFHGQYDGNFEIRAWNWYDEEVIFVEDLNSLAEVKEWLDGIGTRWDISDITVYDKEGNVVFECDEYTEGAFTYGD